MQRLSVPSKRYFKYLDCADTMGINKVNKTKVTNLKRASKCLTSFLHTERYSYSSSVPIEVHSLHSKFLTTINYFTEIFTKVMTMLMLSAMVLVGTGFAEDDFRIFVVSPLEGPISNRQIFLPFTGLARGGRQQVFPGGGNQIVFLAFMLFISITQVD